jgi:hypothetical protein
MPPYSLDNNTINKTILKTYGNHHCCVVGEDPGPGDPRHLPRLLTSAHNEEVVAAPFVRSFKRYDLIDRLN